VFDKHQPQAEKAAVEAKKAVDEFLHKTGFAAGAVTDKVGPKSLVNGVLANNNGEKANGAPLAGTPLGGAPLSGLP
ncbi:hypothetical protein BGZ49_002531, partial [Haplosporangium sp. Z 27]